MCKTVCQAALAIQNAVLTHIPSHICNEDAIFLETSKSGNCETISYPLLPSVAFPLYPQENYLHFIEK